ncbi:TonB-dependent receptor domain-containing protein [Sphingomonas flavescens]|uniref:TonB-dependent receptor domain-containing protein n=1 Tax=Sphingomonas flavescens TaxID=3132797 RepID=UPI0028045BC6|nr:TonB-dependent receptor [Sphingomonas limnosediminicola]
MMRLNSVLHAGVAFAALSIGATASAQGTVDPAAAPPEASVPTAGNDIVITGSRIRRSPLDLNAPRVFIDKADMEKTGLNSVNDVLQRLPSAGGGINSKFNNSGNLGNPPNGAGVGAGSAEIDLRYLGSVRTLVLVDGLRYLNGASASGVPGSVDLNSIPESMIERVEVLQDGASTIYGSDAIAGVVNIITKERQQGFAASAQVGSYLDHDDGWTQNYQLSWGNGGNSSTQIVVGGNYVKSDGVLAADRAISAFPSPYTTACSSSCSSYPLTGRYSFVFAGGPLTLNAPFTTTAPPYPASFRPFAVTDRFNFAPYNYLDIPLKRYGLFGNLVQELNGDTHLRIKALWNRRESVNQAAPIPLGVGPDTGSGTPLDNITISRTNPYNPFGFDLIPNGQPGGNYNDIRRRVVEAGPRRFEQTVKTYYGSATLDGRLGGEWYWDVNGIWGRNKASQVMYGNLNAAKVAQALGPIANCTGSCVPLNVFGTPGAITPAMLAFIGFDQHDTSQQKLWGTSANISGKWFDVGGGPLGVAVGAEYRRLTGRFDPDPVVQAGNSSDIPAQASRGGYKVAEVYAEFNAPFIKGRPGAELLELNGSGRYSHYKTDSGRTFSHSVFKTDLNWKPVDAVRLRASYAEGFRAPTIGELEGSPSRFDSQIDDPCSNASAQARRFSNDATVRANCVARGVPATGSTTGPNDQLSVITGGNEALTPETSTSVILGVVVNPIRGFTAEMNWYNIKVKDAIQSISATTTLYRCVYQNDPLACAAVSRAPGTGNVLQIQGVLQNIASIRTTGIDLNLAYRTRLSNMGTVGLTWNNTFLTKYDVTTPTATGTAVEQRAGLELGSPTQGFPKWKSIGVLDWDYGIVGATVTGRYISSLKEILNNNNRLKSVFYTDAQVRLKPRFNFLLQDLELAVGVNNLFNKKTPGCLSCDTSGNFDANVYDTPGRYYYARLAVKLGARREAPVAYTPPPAPPPPPAAEPAPVVEPVPAPSAPPPPAATPERGK